MEASWLHTVIALWLCHEQISTTNICLHANLTQKQQAIDRTKLLAARLGRYRPPDTLLAFLEASDYADPDTAITPVCNAHLAKVGITRRSA